MRNNMASSGLRENVILTQILLTMDSRGVEQDLIPYLGWLELVNVPVKEWIIDHDVHGLLYGPSDVAHLPTYYEKAVQTDVMTRHVAMVINGGRGTEVFLEPFLEDPCRFPLYSSSQSTLSHLHQ